jgi:hypothetical protein
MATPSLRFPLRAGGTEWARGLVPLAKRGGGNLKLKGVGFFSGASAPGSPPAE